MADPQADLSVVDKAHPAYAQGFDDASDLTPLYDDCPSAEYRAGWLAYHDMARILRNAGFVGDGHNFTKTI